MVSVDLSTNGQTCQMCFPTFFIKYPIMPKPNVNVSGVSTSAPHRCPGFAIDIIMHVRVALSSADTSSAFLAESHKKTARNSGPVPFTLNPAVKIPLVIYERSPYPLPTSPCRKSLRRLGDVKLHQTTITYF